MAKKYTLTPVQLARPMRDGEDQETYEITITQNEESLNQNMTFLNDRLYAIEAALSSMREE